MFRVLIGLFLTLLVWHNPSIAQSEIQVGEVITGELVDGIAQYAFRARVSDVLFITVQSEDFPPFILLRNAQRERIGYSNFGSAWVDAQLLMTIRRSDEYVVTIGAVNDAMSGAFTLQVKVLDTISLNFGDDVDVEFDGTVPAYYFQFYGFAGNVVDIRAFSGGLIDTRISVTDTNNTEIVYNDDASGSVDPYIRQFVIPKDDFYVIEVENFDPNVVGEITLILDETQWTMLEHADQSVNLQSTNDETFSYPVVAGQRYQLRLDRVSVSENPSEQIPIVYIQMDDQTFVASAVGNQSDSLDVVFRVPRSGTALIRVQDYFPAEYLLQVLPVR